VTDTGAVTNIHHIPPNERRRLAAGILPVAVVLLVVGLLLISQTVSIGWLIAGGVVLVLALLMLAIVLGLQSSARKDEQARLRALEQAEYDNDLDAAITEATVASGVGCGGACGTCLDDTCAAKTLPRL